MKKRKILSAILSVTLLASFVIGCGSKQESTATSGKMDKSPITLTFYNCDSSTDMPFDDDVAKKITELTGVTLKITHPVSSGDQQAIPLMIASGEYPDLIYAKSDTGKLIDAGGIIKLDDYIEKQGKNLKALYGDNLKKLRYSVQDPSIYTVGTDRVVTQAWDPDGSMQLQNAVLKELGYPKIKTIYDYEKAIKDYIAKHPEINGKKTIGMSMMASDWRWVCTVGNTASNVIGLPDDGQFKVDEDTKKATYKFQLPEIKEYFKWLNHMYAEGLLDPESFTQKEDAFRAKLTQGNVLGTTEPKWDYSMTTQALRGAGMEERTFATLPVTTNEKYKDQSLKDYGYAGGRGISITSSCKDKDRAFQFLDWLASDEAQVLLNWGIEGKHYTVENGKRVLKPEIQKQMTTDKDFSKKTGVGLYVYPLPERGDGEKDPTGNTYTTNSIDQYIANYSAAEKETLAAYGVKSWPELFPKREELSKSNHGKAWQYVVASDSDIAIIQKKADDYIQKSVTQAIIGKEADFDAAWDKIQVDLKEMGIDKVNEGMSKLTQDTMKLWS